MSETPPQWEYKVDDFTFDSKWSVKQQAAEFERFQNGLNDRGKLGWEMVSYQAVPVTNWSDKVKSYAYLLVMKRPLAPE